MLLTFSITVLAWVFFRSGSVSQAFSILKEIFSPSLFSLPELRPTVVLSFLIVFIFIEWKGRRNEYALEKMPKPLSEHETEVPTAVAEAEKDPKAAITH